MDSASWDRRYQGSELVWTAQPNRFLVAETETLAPARAIDLACGEGRNAIWLAEQGWQAVGVDFSEIGLQKARELASPRGVDVEWVAADYVAIFTPNATGALRLVGEAYPFHRGDRPTPRAITTTCSPIPPSRTSPACNTPWNGSSWRACRGGRVDSRFLLASAGMLDALGSLRHTDGRPAATVYGPRAWHQRGATIAFNFLHPDGRVIDERYVDRVARRHNVSLRTGCFCNPGAGEVAFTISRETLLGGEFGEGMTLDDYLPQIGLPSGGAIRASLGLASNYQDLYRFTDFASEFVDLTEVPNDLPPRIAC